MKYRQLKFMSNKYFIRDKKKKNVGINKIWIMKLAMER